MKLIDVLNKMKIKDLKKEIASQNIKGYSKLKKNELVKLIMNREDRFKYLLLNNMNQKKELLEDKIKLKEAKDKMKNIVNKKLNLHIVTKQDIDDIKRINKKNDAIDDNDYSYLGITNEQADDITYGKKKAILVKATKKTRTPLQAKVIKPVKKTRTPLQAKVIKPIKKTEVKPEVKKPEVKVEVKKDLSDDEKELEKLDKKQINLENRLSSIKPNRYNKDTNNLIQSTQKELLEVKLSIYELKDKMKGKDEKEFNNKDKGNIKEFEKLVKKFIKKPTKQLLDDIDNKFELVDYLDDEIAEELEFQIDKFEKGQKKIKKKLK